MSECLPPFPAGWTQERLQAIALEERKRLMSGEEMTMVETYLEELDRRLEEELDARGNTPGAGAALCPCPPLPPTWTVERYKDTDWDDEKAVARVFETESDQDGQMILDYHGWHVDNEIAQNQLPEDAADSRDPEQERLANKYGFKDCWTGVDYGELMSLAKLFESSPERTCFGFVVFKTWGYGTSSEQQRWQSFWQKWLEFFDEGFRLMGATGNLRSHGIAGKLKWHVVEDPGLQGASLETISRRHDAMCQASEVEWGIDWDLSLVPSEDFARQLNCATSYRQRSKLAVLGVDLNGPSPVSTDIEDDTIRQLALRGVDTSRLVAQIYPGAFPIEIGGLFPAAYETLRQSQPIDVYPGRDDAGRPNVWDGLPRDGDKPMDGQVDEHGRVLVSSIKVLRDPDTGVVQILP